jgi:hypothetical protein
MSVEELEKHIQGMSRDVDELRARQLRAHDWLEVRQQQQRRRVIEGRPAGGPETQVILPGALTLGAPANEEAK